MAAVAQLVLIGLGLFVVAIAIFLRLQHRGMFAVSARLAGALFRNDRISGAAGGASAIDDAVVSIYRERSALCRASTLRLVGWAAGTGENLARRTVPGPADRWDRRFHPRKPWRRRTRRRVHGAGCVGRARRQLHCILRTVRIIRGYGPRDFSLQAGTRDCVGSAGPTHLAMGRRFPLLSARRSIFAGVNASADCKYARNIDPTAEINPANDSVRKYGNRAGSSFARNVTPIREVD